MYFYNMVRMHYSEFGIFVENPAYTCTPAEWIERFPGLATVAVDYIMKYENGYYFRYLVQAEDNFTLKCAIVNNDTSFLTASELECYNSLKKVVEDKIDSSMTDVKKIRVIHDFITDNTIYNTTGSADEGIPDYCYEPEGVLLYGRAVCDGYSKTFELFMTMLDIPCIRISGKAGDGDLVEHSWNQVMVGTQWYNVDVTWDDPVPDQQGRRNYLYFLVPDKMMYDHSWRPVVTCTDMSLVLYSYENVVKTRDEMAFLLRAAYADGKRQIQMLFPSSLGTGIVEDVLKNEVRFEGKISYLYETRGDYYLYNLSLEEQ